MTRAQLETQLLEAPKYYHYYIGLVEDEGPVVGYLLAQGADFLRWARSQSEFSWRYRYAEGKWSMGEVLGHLLDCERIMAYRALCLARGEEQSLPGFDDSEYVLNARFDERSPESLLQEFETVRAATVSLLGNFRPADWEKEGKANGQNVSVAAIAFMIAGHFRHHWNVIRERYLGENPAF